MANPNDQRCVSCPHPRSSHSRNGCEEYTNMGTGKQCTCKNKFTDNGKFS